MASHAVQKESNPNSRLNLERIKSFAALIAQAYAVICSFMAYAGINPLPFTDDQVSTAVFTVITALISIYNWWHHNAVTKAGYDGKQLTTALKNGTVAQTQGTDAPKETASRIYTTAQPVSVDPLADLYSTSSDGSVNTDNITGTPVIEVG